MLHRVICVAAVGLLIAGFVPYDEFRTYTASYYATGEVTANGESFNPTGLTAAHRRYPFGTLLLVTNTANQRAVVVRVNDRGPYVDGRTLDLTIGAAEKLGMLDEGLAEVIITVVE
jgi:rare lipoprotein A